MIDIIWISLFVFLAIPIVVYYFMVRKNWTDAVVAQAKIIGSVFVLSFFMPVILASIIGPFAVLLWWHKPKGLSLKEILFYFVVVNLVAFIYLLLVGVAFLGFFDFNMMSVAGGLM